MPRMYVGRGVDKHPPKESELGTARGNARTRTFYRSQALASKSLFRSDLGRSSTAEIRSAPVAPGQHCRFPVTLLAAQSPTAPSACDDAEHRLQSAQVRPHIYMMSARSAELRVG